MAAVEDNLLSQFELLATTAPVTPLPDGDLTAYTSEVAFPLFNAISGARFAPGTEARRTSEVLDLFLARGLPFLWWATPSTMTPVVTSIIRPLTTKKAPNSAMLPVTI